jgi:chromosome segregation ATPase
VLLAGALAFVPTVHAQDAAAPTAPTPPTPSASEILTAAVAEQARADGEAARSQERVSELDDETQKLLAQYRTALGEKDSIEAYSAQLAIQVQSQVDDIESIERQLSEVETTAREVLPLTQKMLDTLSEFVELDVPFLIDERRKRIKNLQNVMTRADVSLSEKYRRVLEAYQIEMEYGRTLEAYEGHLGDAVDARTVNFLRVGRVSLMYQTLDGNETGYWDADAKNWVVDDDYRRAFEHGIGIAKKLTAPDLIRVPVPAPKESQS